MERIDNFSKNPFLDGPAEFLVKTVAEQLGGTKQWRLVFGDQIDPYLRMDYSMRSLPALRIYNRTGNKQSDSGWATGEMLVDAIFPASQRRRELQQVQDTVTGALINQFRSGKFFTAVAEGTGKGADGVPALNELGRVMTWDKTLGFPIGETDIVPLTQFTLNFKLDLRRWDDYLESQYRTTDDPFEKTLEDLRGLAVTIRALTKTDGTATDPQAVQEGVDANV